MNHPDDIEDWPLRNTDLGQAMSTLFNEMKDERFYHGQKYEKAKTGFTFRGKPYSSLQEIYSAIDTFLDEGDKTLLK